MNRTIFRKATLDDIETIQQIVAITWPVTYGTIVSPEQLNYMIALLYSHDAMKKQMESLQQFIMLEENGEAIAFASYSLTDQPNIYKLNKLYALPSQQGKGTGKNFIHYILNEITALGATALQLNVNRFNKAKNFYEHLGFVIIKEEDVDIGNGFFMNDYVMERKI